MIVLTYKPESDFTNNYRSISSNLLSLLQRYSLRSIYFIYRSQRIYLNTIGNTYFDDPINWSSFGTNIIVFYLSRDELNGRQFFYSTQNYPNVPVYYNPLNFYETSLVQTDSSYFMLTVNNQRYKIFSCGKTIFSFIIEGVPPNATGTTEPALIEIGSDAYYKKEPDGKPLFTSSTMKIVAPNNFNQIIYFPLYKSLNNVSVECLKLKTENYGDYVDQAVNLPTNSRYFLQQLSNNINIQPQNSLSGIDITQNSPFTIDTIFCSKIPQVGCATIRNLFNDNTCPFEFINRAQLQNLTVDSNGNIVPTSISNQCIYIYDMYYSNYSAGIETLITYTNVVDASQFPTRTHVYDLSGTYEGAFQYSSPEYYSGSRLIFEWDDASLMDKFDVPCQSINAMLYLSTQPPLKFSIKDVRPSPLLYNDYLTDDSGYFNIANGILSSSRANYGMILLKVFSEIKFASGATNYLLNSDKQDCISEKNLQDALKLAHFVGTDDLSEYASACTDQNPFNLGVRIMPSDFDYRSYYKFNHFVKSSIIVNTELSDFAQSSEYPEYFELDYYVRFESFTILPRFREIGCVVSPCLNTGISNSRSLVVLADCVQKKRGQLRCLFIEQQDKNFIMFYPITNFTQFKLYVNDISQRQEGVNELVFTLLLK
jgi:hypothetical protein